MDTVPKLVRVAQRRGWVLSMVATTHRRPGMAGVRYSLSTTTGGGRALTYETDDRGRMFAHATYVAGNADAIHVYTPDDVMALL